MMDSQRWFRSGRATLRSVSKRFVPTWIDWLAARAVTSTGSCAQHSHSLSSRSAHEDPIAWPHEPAHFRPCHVGKIRR